MWRRYRRAQSRRCEAREEAREHEKKDHRERRKEMQPAQEFPDSLTESQSRGRQGEPGGSSQSTAAGAVNPVSIGKWVFSSQSQEAEGCIPRPWPGDQRGPSWPHSSVQHPGFWRGVRCLPTPSPLPAQRSLGDSSALTTHTRSVGTSALRPRGCRDKVPQAGWLQRHECILSQFWGLGNPKSGCCEGRVFFLKVFSLSVHVAFPPCVSLPKLPLVIGPPVILDGCKPTLMLSF